MTESNITWSDRWAEDRPGRMHRTPSTAYSVHCLACDDNPLHTVRNPQTMAGPWRSRGSDSELPTHGGAQVRSLVGETKIP